MINVTYRLLLKLKSAAVRKNAWSCRGTCLLLIITPAAQVRNFLAALELFRRIGEVALEEGHHPDLHVQGYNSVSVELYTHASGAPLPDMPASDTAFI